MRCARCNCGIYDGYYDRACLMCVPGRKSEQLGVDSSLKYTSSIQNLVLLLLNNIYEECFQGSEVLNSLFYYFSSILHCSLFVVHTSSSAKLVFLGLLQRPFLECLTNRTLRRDFFNSKNRWKWFSDQTNRLDVGIIPGTNYLKLP